MTGVEYNSLTNHRTGFTDFVFRSRKYTLLVTIVIILTDFMLLKFLFPHAILVQDSHHYIQAAIDSTEISAWPIGYSKFLAAIHLVSQTDWAVVVVQYFLLESTLLYFYFSLDYFFAPTNWTKGLIITLLLFNPFIVSISNYIMSDSLFAALTIYWFTKCMWLIHKPKK